MWCSCASWSRALAVALAARLVYNEPYRAVPMRAATPAAPGEGLARLGYEWKIGRTWQRLAARRVGSSFEPVPGSEEAFITEHHWGYTRQRDGGTLEYEVAHPVWRVWTAADPVLDVDVIGLYGERFAKALAGSPTSVLVAEGSPVTVYAPRRLATDLTMQPIVMRRGSTP